MEYLCYLFPSCELTVHSLFLYYYCFFFLLLYIFLWVDLLFELFHLGFLHLLSVGMCDGVHLCYSTFVDLREQLLRIELTFHHVIFKELISGRQT